MRSDAARIFKAIEDRGGDDKGLRDLAICRLLLDLGLRRTEIVALNVGDFADGVLTLRCKRLHGAHQLPKVLADAIQQWLAVRGPGTPEEPMFIPLDPVAQKEERKTRLTGVGINKMVSAYGRPNGVFTSPRGLRQSGTVDRKQDVTFRY
jgi:integrase/recombinase XerC